MKKGLEKLLSIAMFIVGVVLVVLLMLTVFGTLDETTLANEVVRSMIIGLSLLFLVCAVVMIVVSFKDSDVLKAIVLSSERVSTTRVSLSVIRNIVSKNAKHIKGLKVSGIALMMDENNLIRMKLTVKIAENDVDVIVDKFRCLLFDAFYELLGVEFSSIDFKVKALSPKYAPDMNKIDRAALEIKEKRERLMFEKLKMEEEEAKFDEERKIEAERRRKEEARLRKEREETRRKEKLREEEKLRRLEDIVDGAEELPVYITHENYEMPAELQEDLSGVGRGDETLTTGASEAAESARFETNARTEADSSTGADRQTKTNAQTITDAQTATEGDLPEEGDTAEITEETGAEGVSEAIESSEGLPEASTGEGNVTEVELHEEIETNQNTEQEDK